MTGEEEANRIIFTLQPVRGEPWIGIRQPQGLAMRRPAEQLVLAAFGGFVCALGCGQYGLDRGMDTSAILVELIESAGLKRDDVFITNIVKHRPPGNRDPLPDEIAACAIYLERQIAAIDPDVVVTLGRHSMNRYFPGERISRIHGKPKRVGTRLIVPMYHPAAALHNGSLRSTIEDDFRQLPKFLAEQETERTKRQEAEEKPEQGSLF